jgi:hypothetical protein
MVGPKNGFFPRNRFFAEREGFGLPTLGSIRVGQVVDAPESVTMVRGRVGSCKSCGPFRIDQPRPFLHRGNKTTYPATFVNGP